MHQSQMFRRHVRNRNSRGTGGRWVRTMGSTLLDILNPIYEQHPEIKPEELK